MEDNLNTLEELQQRKKELAKTLKQFKKLKDKHIKDYETCNNTQTKALLERFINVLETNIIVMEEEYKKLSKWIIIFKE